MALALADAVLDPAGYSSQGFMVRLAQWLRTLLQPSAMCRHWPQHPSCHPPLRHDWRT